MFTAKFNEQIKKYFSLYRACFSLSKLSVEFPFNIGSEKSSTLNRVMKYFYFFVQRVSIALQFPLEKVSNNDVLIQFWMFIERWQNFCIQNKINCYVYIYGPSNIQFILKYTLVHIIMKMIQNYFLWMLIWKPFSTLKIVFVQVNRILLTTCFSSWSRFSLHKFMDFFAYLLRCNAICNPWSD